MKRRPTLFEGLTISEVLFAVMAAPILWFLVCLILRCWGCVWPGGLF